MALDDGVSVAERDNHHFVPQFYFRCFSTDGRSICLLNRATGALVRQASIRGQASKSKFYGSQEVEKALGDLEGTCSAALRALLQSRNPAALDDKAIMLVLTWLTLQRSRTIAARHASKPMHDKLLRLYLEMTLAQDTSLSEEERAALQGSFDEVESNPVRDQLMQMQVAMQSADVLADLQPVLLVNRTNRPFIFSDAPVVFYNCLYRKVKLRGVLGADTPGLIVLFPLGPELLLILCDHACYELRRLRNHQIQIRDHRDVRALNKLQIHSAAACVYFHDSQFSNYVAELWREERPSLTRRVATVVEAPGFDADTREPLGEIMHSFEPQLPFALELSFMKHQVLGDTEYQFQRRSDRHRA